MVVVAGLAVPYSTAALIGQGPHRTRFDPGAFAAAIQGGTVKLFINHKSCSCVASQGTGTLAFDDRPSGLFFGATIRGPWADVIGRLDRVGLLKGASVGIGGERVGWWHYGSHPGEDVRVVADAHLLEVSLVTGAYQPAFETWAHITDPASLRGADRRQP